MKEKSKREKKTGEKIWKCRDHGRKLENYGKCFLNHGENCLLMYQEQCNVQYIIFCENFVICPVHLNNTKWLPYKKLLYVLKKWTFFVDYFLGCIYYQIKPYNKGWE